MSHTTLSHWVEVGELLRDPTNPRRVDLDDLIEVASSLDSAAAKSNARHPLAVALHQRIPDPLRAVALHNDIPPAQIAAWLRSGLLRDSSTTEQEWLAGHAELALSIERVIRNVDGIDTAVLFGSIARGTPTTTSDIDLLVEGAAVDDPSAMAAMRGRLMEATGRDVDVLPLRQARAAPWVLAAAFDEARPIVDEQGAWAQTVAARTAIDSAARTAFEDDGGRERALLDLLTSENAR